jgi:hypothetical protein
MKNIILILFFSATANCFSMSFVKKQISLISSFFKKTPSLINTSNQSNVMALSDFSFNAATVMPLFKSNGEYFVILAREKYGRDKGTFDGFGGSKNIGERHPVLTASRECSEETINLLGTQKEIKQHIDVLKNNDLSTGNTLFIIANQNKKAVFYVTEFDKAKIMNFTSKFYDSLSKAKKFENKEKDKLAIIKWEKLVKTFAQASKDSNGKLTLPIKMSAEVLTKDGQKIEKEIILRPYLVSSMHRFCKGDTPDLQSKHIRIKIYKN